MFKPSSSDHVLHQQVRSMVETQPMRAQEVYGVFREILEPRTHLLRSKGKLPRGDIWAMCRAFIDTLKDHPAVVSVFVRSTTRGTRHLSANENATIRVIVMTSRSKNLPKPVMVFYACEITLTRRDIEITVHNMDFQVFEHIAVRFLRREIRSTGSLVSQFHAPLQIGLPLSLALPDHGEHRIVVPMASGLAFGPLITTPLTTVRPVEVLRYDHAGPSTYVKDRTREQVFNLEKRRYHTFLKTFCDFDSLRPVEERLHARLLAFTKTHAEALERFQHNYHFGNYFVEAATTDQKSEVLTAANQGILDMFDATHALIRGPEWRAYSALRDEIESREDA